MKTSDELNEKESHELAMMCWESLDDLEQESKKRKTHAKDEETNDKANKIDNKMHTKHTANMGIQLIDDLKLGADDNVSTLATQETLAKNLVYTTNIPEGKLVTVKNIRDSSKNPGKQDDKKCSPLEQSDQVTSNDNLNAYGESDRDDTMEKGKVPKKNTWQTRKIIHMEFESDDDVAEQSKNAHDVKAEGKVRVKKKTVHYYEYSSKEEDEEHTNPKKLRKPKIAMRIQGKMMKMIRLWSPMK